MISDADSGGPGAPGGPEGPGGAEALDPRLALAWLEWQLEFGATEAIGEAPVDRFALAAAERAAGDSRAPAGPGAGGFPGPGAGREAAEPAGPGPLAAPAFDPAAQARAMAAAARDLADLREAIGAFEHCELKRGARNLVFADGNPAARVMIVGEAPGREEDQRGLPFVGRAGRLLDRMLAAIGLSRGSPDAEAAVYITNVLNWRPPQNREPTAEEIGMMLPFLQRHVEIVDPQVLVLMGNISCLALLGQKGITRLRGRWVQVGARPALPMFHPAYLLRNPHAKREAWADLLVLRDRLRGG